jgi:hypothetical protein
MNAKGLERTMKSIGYVLILGAMLAATASARELPSYYPTDELRRAGEIDAVNLEENQVVIDDVPYRIADDVVVHSLSAYSVSKVRLRPGGRVAFRMGSGNTITTFWLLPRGYEPGGRR